jgi:tetratricopeptide (TPR) repeat protein
MIKRKEIITYFILTFLISGGVYLYTVAPTVTFGDSGDFITASYGLRYAHPPGYPTYILLAKLFTFLPFSADIAYRVNLLSAFFAATSVGVTYIIIFLLLQWYCLTEEDLKSSTVAHIGAMSGALTFAFSGTFWSQALVAKVHPLSAFFTALIILLVLLYARTRERRYWYAGIFFWAFSLGIHHTTVLYVPVIIIFLLLQGQFKNTFSLKPLFIGISLALLGFSVYLLLPLVTPHLGMIEWGKADTWKGFKEILLRSDYPPFEWSRSWDLLKEQLGSTVWVLLTGQSVTITGLVYGIFLGLCALFGLSWLGQNDKSSSILLGGIAIVVWIFFCAVNNHPMTQQLSLETRDVFFIPAYLIYGIWAGIGITRIGYTLINDNSNRRFLLYIICLIFVLTGFVTQLPKHNERNYYLAYDFGKDILDTMEPNALFIGDDDLHVFPVWYLQQVEHYRTDVTVLSRTSLALGWYYEGLRRIHDPKLQIPAFNNSQVPKDHNQAFTFVDWQMFQFFKQNVSQRPCYFYEKYTLRINPPLPITQEGLIYHVTSLPVENAVPIPEHPYPYLPPKINYVYRFSPLDISQKDFWRTWAFERLSDYHYDQGVFYFDNKEFPKAENELKQSVQLEPENISAHYQLGLLYQTLDKNELAIEEYNRVLLLDPEDHLGTKKRLLEIKNNGK